MTAALVFRGAQWQNTKALLLPEKLILRWIHPKGLHKKPT